MNMRITPTQKVIKLSELSIEKLTIPVYQRPYKWKEKNVIQLLEDIFEYVILKNKDYRIGNIILHNENSINNVVDGQQRLTTISILLKILDESYNGLLLNEKFKHNISKNNIVYNYRIIDKWIKTKFESKDEKKSDFKNKILNKCEFILFTVFKQDEAFQLFDSQNARGKALEPYDLLKAFHLREMDFDSESDRTKCVERWETSVDNGTLKPILGNHLFKIRKWSKNEWKYDFTKDDIDEFKGISLHQKQKYPYESAIRMLDGFVENAQNDKFLRNLQIAQTFPFQISSPIINGKRFFEYVDFYITLREKLFDYNKEDSIKAEMPEFVKFYKEYCYGYNGCWRSGDEKVRNLYENILLAFIDKFSYVDDFENFCKAFYKLTYEIRCNTMRINVETIMNSSARQLFSKINDSVSPNTFKNYQYKTYQIKDDRVKGIEKIVDFIRGFEFEKELKQQIFGKGLKIEEENEYYLIPFQYLGNQLHIYIGDKNNPNWYGFGGKKHYAPLGEDINKFQEIIKKIELPKSDKSWFGWKEIKISTKEDIKTIVEDIDSWIKMINEQ
jgi:hypothetical protein